MVSMSEDSDVRVMGYREATVVRRGKPKQGRGQSLKLKCSKRFRKDGKLKLCGKWATKIVKSRPQCESCG